MEIASLIATIGADTTGLTAELGRAEVTLRQFASTAARQAGLAGGAFATGADQAAAATGRVSAAAALAGRDLQRIGAAGQALQGLGQTLTVGVTAPVLAMGAAAAKAAIDFESAFAGVKKTLNTNGLDATQTQAEYARLSDGIRQLAQEIPAAATEIAGVAEAAGQLGIQRANVLGFTKVMIDLGNSTNLAANEAATSLARLANITGLPQTQFENLGSAIVALGNNFATTEAEITAMSLRIAGAGKQVGLTEAQVLGFSTALSSVGIEAEAGGTAFSTTLKKIQGAVETGGKSLTGFANVAGVSAEAFRKSFQQDAAGATIKFIEGLGRIKSEGGSTLQTLESLELADIRVSDALLRLSGAGDLARRSVALGSAAFVENTALAKEAGQRYETTASQIQLAKNRLNDLGITLGNSLLPLTRGLASAVGSISDRFKTLSPETIRTAGALAVTAAAVGPVLLAIGSLGAAIPTLVAGLGTVGAAVGLAAGPLALLVIGVGAAAVAIVTHWDEIKETFEQPVFQELARTVQESAGIIGDAFAALGGSANFGELFSATGIVGDTVKQLGTEITAVLDIINGLVRTTDSLLNLEWARAWDGAKQSVLGLAGPLANIFGYDYAALRASLNVLGDGAFQGPSLVLTPENPFTDLNAGLAGYLGLAKDGSVVSETLATSLGKVSAGGKQAAALTDAMQKALADLQAALRLNANLSTALGTEYDYLQGRQEALENGIRSLVKAGFSPLSRTVQNAVQEVKALKAAYTDLGTISLKLPVGVSAPKVEDVQGAFVTGLEVPPLETAAYDRSVAYVESAAGRLFSTLSDARLQSLPAIPGFITTEFEESVVQTEVSALRLVDTIKNLDLPPLPVLPPFDISSFADGVQQLTDQQAIAFERVKAFNTNIEELFGSFGQLATDSILTFADSIGQAAGAILVNGASIGDGLGIVFGGILSALSSFMSSFGAQLVAIGIGKLSLDTLFKGPAGGPLAIAAGVGLIALSGIASALARNSSKSLSSIGSGGGGGSLPSSSVRPNPTTTPAPLKIEITMNPVELGFKNGSISSYLALESYRKKRS